MAMQIDFKQNQKTHTLSLQKGNQFLAQAKGRKTKIKHHFRWRETKTDGTSIEKTVLCTSNDVLWHSTCKTN